MLPRWTWILSLVFIPLASNFVIEISVEQLVFNVNAAVLFILMCDSIDLVVNDHEHARTFGKYFIASDYIDLRRLYVETSHEPEREQQFLSLKPISEFQEHWLCPERVFSTITLCNGLDMNTYGGIFHEYPPLIGDNDPHAAHMLLKIGEYLLTRPFAYSHAAASGDGFFGDRLALLDRNLIKFGPGPLLSVHFWLLMYEKDLERCLYAIPNILSLLLNDHDLGWQRPFAILKYGLVAWTMPRQCRSTVLGYLKKGHEEAHKGTLLGLVLKVIRMGDYPHSIAHLWNSLTMIAVKVLSSEWILVGASDYQEVTLFMQSISGKDPTLIKHIIANALVSCFALLSYTVTEDDVIVRKCTWLFKILDPQWLYAPQIKLLYSVMSQRCVDPLVYMQLSQDVKDRWSKYDHLQRIWYQRPEERIQSFRLSIEQFDLAFGWKFPSFSPIVLNCWYRFSLFITNAYLITLPTMVNTPIHVEFLGKAHYHFSTLVDSFIEHVYTGKLLFEDAPNGGLLIRYRVPSALWTAFFSTFRLLIFMKRRIDLRAIPSDIPTGIENNVWALNQALRKYFSPRASMVAIEEFYKAWQASLSFLGPLMFTHVHKYLGNK